RPRSLERERQYLPDAADGARRRRRSSSERGLVRDRALPPLDWTTAVQRDARARRHADLSAAHALGVDHLAEERGCDRERKANHDSEERRLPADRAATVGP